MSIEEKSKIIMTTEIKELLETRDLELKKVLKLKLMLNEVRSLNLRAVGTTEISRALKLLSVMLYNRLAGDQEYLLDLQEYSKCTPLSYTNTKTVRKMLAANLRTTLSPIVVMGNKIRNELPETLISEDDPQLSASQRELIWLQKEQQEYLGKLMEKYSEKCELMIKASDLKMGSLLSHKLKMQQAQAQLLQTKSELLQKYLKNGIFSRTEHSLRAHKVVDKYLDELLIAKKP